MKRSVFSSRSAAGSKTRQAEGSSGNLARVSLRLVAERWSLVVAFVIAFAVFAASRADTFLTWANAQAILDNASVLTVVVVGVTVVLLLGEFDLSIGWVIGLAGVAAVSVMAFHGWPAWAAVLVAIAAGGAVGLANGLTVSYLRVPSFIATLAIGSIAAAIELAISPTSIFEGLAPAYLDIATTRVGGFTLRAIFAGGLAILLLVLLRTTVYGRHAASIGDNPLAARLTGIPVQRATTIGFVISGLCAGLAAVLVTSSATSYYPNSGTGYLLPAYAAAFLGLSLGGGVRFNIIGSYLGALLLVMVTTGLTMMNQPSWVAALVQGFVLLAAVAGIALRRRGGVGR